MQFNESRALATLASTEGTEAKARACQQLAIVGGAAAVPALAGLLGDEKLASHARSGLENISDPRAGAALIKALPSLDGRLLAGAVTSLGVRRETAAVPELQLLIDDPKRGAAEPALAALGQIASDQALVIILKILSTGPAGLRVPAAQAALAATERVDPESKAKLFKAVNSADVPAHVKAAASL
jgi:HEAT repeat protein